MTPSDAQNTRLVFPAVLTKMLVSAERLRGPCSLATIHLPSAEFLSGLPRNVGRYASITFGRIGSRRAANHALPGCNAFLTIAAFPE
jgi:hypothetical protein